MDAFVIAQPTEGFDLLHLGLVDVEERALIGRPRLDIKRLEQHPSGIVQRGLTRDLRDNRRKQVRAAVLILESGAGRVLRTRLQQLRNCRAIGNGVVNLSCRCIQRFG